MYLKLLLYHLYIIIFLSPFVVNASDTLTGYDSSSPVDPKSECQPLSTPFCNIESYLTVHPFKNTLGHTSLDAAEAELHKHFYLLKRDPCKSIIQLFLCALYAPVCVPNSPTKLDFLLPCRDDCEQARETCISDLELANSTWLDEWDCRKFNFHKDDKLCVINTNARSTAAGLPTPPPPPLIGLATDNLEDKEHYMNMMHAKLEPRKYIFGSNHDNDTVCPEDLFDCRMRDSTGNMKGFCIDQRWVCDGKKDCICKDCTSDEGLDEIGCDKRCVETQMLCDGKCISKSILCNGRVECSSGIDEQDCYDYLTGLIQSVLCIFALFSAIYLLVRFFRIDDEEEQKVEYNPTPQHDLLFEPEHLQEPSPTHHHSPEQQHQLHQQQLTLHQKLDDYHYSAPIYHELTCSSRSDYERLNLGGYSGASSVYNTYAYSAYQMHHEVPPTPIHTPTHPFT